MGLLDLENNFAFYGSYHSNSVNIFIHTLFVWPIFFSALILFHYFPVHFLIGEIKPGLVIALFYGLFYVLMDRKGGSLAAVLCYFCWVGGDWVASRIGFPLAWKLVLVTQLVCWTFQFIGHGVFEKRSPALFDNLSQALLMAPFFVLIEVLEKLFHYEPYPGFWTSVLAKIDERRKEWEEKKKKHRHRLHKEVSKI